MDSKEDGTVENPINREPDTQRLVQSFLTPSKDHELSKPQAYDRNHGPIQHIDASTHKVTIKSDSIPTTSQVVPKRLDLVLTVDDLRSKFSQHTVTCALQCAGNRRHEMRSRVKEVSGVDWGDGAVWGLVTKLLPGVRIVFSRTTMVEICWVLADGKTV